MRDHGCRFNIKTIDAAKTQCLRMNTKQDKMIGHPGYRGQNHTPSRITDDEEPDSGVHQSASIESSTAAVITALPCRTTAAECEPQSGIRNTITVPGSAPAPSCQSILRSSTPPLAVSIQGPSSFQPPSTQQRNARDGHPQSPRPAARLLAQPLPCEEVQPVHKLQSRTGTAKEHADWRRNTGGCRYPWWHVLS